MKYQMDRRGIGAMMKKHPGIHRQLHGSARTVLAVARGRARIDTGDLRSSGRVEDLGVRPVRKGEPRMTVAVVFHSDHAAVEERRTGFLSGAISRGPKR